MTPSLSPGMTQSLSHASSAALQEATDFHSTSFKLSQREGESDSDVAFEPVLCSTTSGPDVFTVTDKLADPHCCDEKQGNF